MPSLQATRFIDMKTKKMIPPISATGMMGVSYTLCLCMFEGATDLASFNTRCEKWKKIRKCSNAKNHLADQS